MQFNYSKLLGRMRECGYTQEKIALEIGVSESTLSLKLNNRAFFVQKEIAKICALLGIETSEIGQYFFILEVQKSGTN